MQSVQKNLQNINFSSENVKNNTNV